MSSGNARKIAALGATGAFVAAGTIASAVPAQAGLTTTCVGSAGAVTVPGDLVVPAGESCELSGTIIEGTTIVRGGADLVLLDGAELRGEVTVRNDGFIATEQSAVNAQVNLRAAFGGYFVESTTEGVIDSRNGSYVYSLDSTHNAELTSRQSELYVESATVNADVTSRNDTYADLYDSTVTGDVLVARVNEGSLICKSEVDGNAILRHGDGDIQIGAESPLPDCGFNVFGSDLRLVNNTGEIQLSNNVIRNNLICRDNANAPVGEDNRVRGDARHQCEEIEPAAAQLGFGTNNAFDRSADAEGKFEARLSQAEKAVEKAGSANIG